MFIWAWETAQEAPAVAASRESRFPGSYQIICSSLVETGKFIFLIIDTLNSWRDVS